MGVFRMPSLGADMESAKLVEWTVRPGDTVTRGQVVAVVETQKGAIEIECFEDGIVERIDAQVGDTLAVGEPLAVIGAAAGSPQLGVASGKPARPARKAQRPPSPPPEVPEPPPERPEEPREVPGEAPREVPGEAPEETPTLPPPEFPEQPAFSSATAEGAASASPAARRRAADAGVSLGVVSGSGPGGAVLLEDVERHLVVSRAPDASPPVENRPPRSGLDIGAMRKAIAAAMVRSKREIPHYYLSHQINLQAAADWLAATNQTRAPDERLLMGTLLLRACAVAAANNPDLNGRFTGGAFVPSAAVHAGLVVALRGGGLIAPAIRDADTLGLDALMAAMRDVVARARGGRLRNSELTDGTITVSSMGETGAEALFGVIYPPQVAIVGFGAPQIRPWVVGAAVEPRLVVTATLSADHRVSDGRRGARLLIEIDHLLKEPEQL
ncbi:MAG: dihydrolipoamide acetyltransferase family protein [Phaeovulum sp.]|uniref:dihydrolipoamide acetyltransferase family protein n=1 Tax=Phaeovulum sp. TaxID=2934796 RepID=UPI00272F38ED|nr:dihydrolipoamide acetyltransferase family protein [Phaeovulum sp.]MDP2062984.1 dihydrolipoamide acetyltransferase family protein [Phaeovulum sp.]